MRAVQPGSLPELAERTVTLNGLSKSMAMTGWRIGWAVAPGDGGEVAKAMTRLQSQMTSGIATFLMPAAAQGRGASQSETSAAMRTVFVARARLVAELLGGIDRFKTVPPSGAFYAFPGHLGDASAWSSPAGRRIDSAAAFAEAILEEKEVAVVPGEDFGEIARDSHPPEFRLQRRPDPGSGSAGSPTGSGRFPESHASWWPRRSTTTGRARPRCRS